MSRALHAVRSRLPELVTAVSAVLAAVLHVAVGRSVEEVTGLLVGVALVGTSYLLYRWGGDREPEPTDKSDSETDRERQMRAESGGYGGNAGG